MFDPVLTWSKSPSDDVASYAVSWSKNGTLVRTVTVPRSDGFDSIGYTRKWSDDNSDTPIVDGDTATASVVATDSAGLQSSGVSASVVAPTEPPDPAENVNLTL